MSDVVASCLSKHHKKVIRKLFVWTEVLDYLFPKRESLRIFHKHFCLIVWRCKDTKKLKIEKSFSPAVTFPFSAYYKDGPGSRYPVTPNLWGSTPIDHCFSRGFLYVFKQPEIATGTSRRWRCWGWGNRRIRVRGACGRWSRNTLGGGVWRRRHTLGCRWIEHSISR